MTQKSAALSQHAMRNPSQFVGCTTCITALWDQSDTKKVPFKCIMAFPNEKIVHLAKKSVLFLFQPFPQKTPKVPKVTQSPQRSLKGPKKSPNASKKVPQSLQKSQKTPKVPLSLRMAEVFSNMWSPKVLAPKNVFTYLKL